MKKQVAAILTVVMAVSAGGCAETEYKPMGEGTTTGGETTVEDSSDWDTWMSAEDEVLYCRSFSDCEITDERLAEMVANGEIPLNVKRLQLYNRPLAKLNAVSLRSIFRHTALKILEMHKAFLRFSPCLTKNC
ncbi:MAG: hypothetical protein FWG45_07755, partial [Oscillospiraceae bacterium]|nr:hypothetical protein [Oscillospiraceae bacterium]